MVIFAALTTYLPIRLQTRTTPFTTTKSVLVLEKSIKKIKQMTSNNLFRGRY